jgi:DNA-binding winged helix-turn-helix (wHTH) protein/TolB-like protein/Tfp pilus assembly protein PilF
MSPPVRHFYEFGEFRLDAQKPRLFRNGEVVPLTPKAIETLVVMVQNAGKLLEREELMQTVWAGTFVEDANLTVAVSQLRKALGPNAECIQTIPRVGYRFVANVKALEETAAPLIVEKHTLSQTIVEEEIVSDNADLPLAGPSSIARTDPKALTVQQPVIRGLNQRRLILTMIVLATAAAAGFVFWRFLRKPNLPNTSSQVKSMAILPFKTFKGNAEDEYLGLGLADALITQVGMMREISIRPLSAVRKYDSENQDPLEVGRALGVEAVLEGTVQHEGDQLRVTMRLLRVADGVVLWSGKFDQKFVDLFSMQDSISQQVVKASALDLNEDERARLAKRYTGSFEAYQLYLKGRYFWNKRTAAGLQQSFDLFKQAIEIDPVFALAYAGLADAYALGVWQDALPQKIYIPLAKAAASKALELDETVGEAHASLGFVKFWYEWDFAGAESSFRRAIELRPNHATAHQWYGECLALTGRTAQGIEELKVAQKADPFSSIILSDLGKILYFDGQLDQAIEALKRSAELDPSFPVAHLFLAMAYHRKGMTEEAINSLKHEAEIDGGRVVFKFVLAYIYSQVGRKDGAIKILKELQAPRNDRFTPAYGIALIYVGLGQRDEAFTWLEKSRAEHEPFALYLKADSNFTPLHDDPRFPELLQKIGFN